MPHTTYVNQWGGSHVWKIGGKVFAIGGIGIKEGEQEKPAFIFKASEQNYYFLSEKDGYRPAPYFASRGMKWIQLYESTPELDEELEYYLKQSYQIVGRGLTKKLQKELGLL